MTRFLLLLILFSLLQSCSPSSPKIFTPPVKYEKGKDEDTGGISCETVAKLKASGIYQDCSASDPASCSVSPLSDRDIGTQSTFDLLPSDVLLSSVADRSQITEAFYCRFQDPHLTLSGPLIVDTPKTIPVPGGATRVVAVYKLNTGVFSAAVFNLQSVNLGQQLSVTLQWGAGANDLELHLIKNGGIINNRANPNWVPGNGIFDCTWTSCISRALDWAPLGDPLGDAIKDVDFLQDNGIENIFITGPEATTYNVYVEYWATGIEARPMVNITYGGVVLGQLTISNFFPRQVWFVGTFDQVNRKFIPNGNVVDCSLNWSGGCLLPLY